MKSGLTEAFNSPPELSCLHSSLTSPNSSRRFLLAPSPTSTRAPSPTHASSLTAAVFPPPPPGASFPAAVALPPPHPHHRRHPRSPAPPSPRQPPQISTTATAAPRLLHPRRSSTSPAAKAPPPKAPLSSSPDARDPPGAARASSLLRFPAAGESSATLPRHQRAIRPGPVPSRNPGPPFLLPPSGLPSARGRAPLSSCPAAVGEDFRC